MLHFGYINMSEAVRDIEQSTVETHASELIEPRWSVISYERLEASGLPYYEAVTVLETLDQKGVAGLCIIADEAANRRS